MKIGILGGSFDPIHYGHLNMAINAYKEYALDEVWLVPAGHSPNKNEARMTSAEDRLEMARLAAYEYPYIIANDYEIQKPTTSYTYQTLQELKCKYPENEFYFIMGGDSLDYFDTWRHPELIADAAVILVVIREGFSQDAMEAKVKAIKKIFPCDIRFVHCDRFDISSTQIRNTVYTDSNINDYLPESVLNYIKEHNLYH